MHGMKWIPGALHCLRFWAAPSVWFLLLGILFAQSVIAQGNFISIDCGSTKEHLSGNISWSADTINIGTAKNVNNASQPYDTLRFFPNSSNVKNCYEFNTTVNSAYLLRAGFFYGNYDGKNETPSFELLYNGNLWANVKFNGTNDTVSHEMIALATAQTSSVCVATSSLNTTFDPFISSLEIRPVPFDADKSLPVYQNYLMKLSSRINFGKNNTNETRYPDDRYDRIWESDYPNMKIYSLNYTNRNLTAAMLDFPPSVVMQDAIVVNSTENITVTFPAKYGFGIYYLAFYFADPGFDSVMDVHIDNKLVYTGLNVTNSSVNFGTVKLYLDNYTVTSDTYILTLTANKPSSRPFLNAAESYFLEKANTTFIGDVQALASIKEHFNLSAWMGDPCLPSQYKWSRIECNVTSPANPGRVIGLDLSSMGLPGGMPSELANLSALTKLDLHNNSLRGNVLPALVNLQSLTLLDLSNNNLSGDLPSGLSRENLNLSVNGNPLLCNYSCITERSSGPSSSMAPAISPVSTSSSTTHMGVIVGPVVGGVVLLTFAILGCIFFRRRSQKKHKLFSIHSAHWPPVPPFTEISRVVDPISGTLKEGANDAPLYSFTEMQNITNNFEKRLTLGNAGSLFYGRLPSGQEVVVKLLSSNIQKSPTEFLNMVTRLSYVSHKNLLRPTGFCADIHRFMFIYEHVQKGSLYDLLYTNPSLDWKTRLNILLQVAQGLEYLHHACNPSIIHGNLKSTNVLMSSGMAAKVSDFGIYGLSPTVDATSGYLDPEYFKINSLTEKSDVYSFGVLMLEVVCGRLPFDTSLPKDCWNIIDWVRRTLSLGSIEEIPDPCLNGGHNFGALLRIVQLALKATASVSDERPNMSQMVMEIKEATKTDVSHHVAFTGVEFSDQEDDYTH